MNLSLLNSPVLRYVVIICIVTALAFGQFFKLHMHVDHSEEASNQEHEINLHVAPQSSHILQDGIHHQDDFHSHSHDVVNFDPTVALSKASVLKQVVAIIVFIIFALQFSQVFRVFKRYTYNDKFKIVYYLLSPPLRAPPL
jgi:hypothetical protein